MLERTPIDHHLVQVCNKLDETIIRLEHLEELVKRRLPAPPQPARKPSPAATPGAA